MTLAVVDLLEPIDIDVGKHQLSAPMASAIDLTLEQQQPDLTAKRAGELIQLRTPEVISAQPVILIRARPISDRRLTISGRVRAICGAFSAVDRALLGRRLVNIAVRRSQVSIISGEVAVLGRLISVRDPLPGLRLGAITVGGIIVAVSGGVLAVLGSQIQVRSSPVCAGPCPLLERLLLCCRLVDVTFRRLASRSAAACSRSSAAPRRPLVC